MFNLQVVTLVGRLVDIVKIDKLTKPGTIAPSGLTSALRAPACAGGVTNVRFFLNPQYLNGGYWHRTDGLLLRAGFLAERSLVDPQRSL